MSFKSWSSKQTASRDVAPGVKPEAMSVVPGPAPQPVVGPVAAPPAKKAQGPAR